MTAAAAMPANGLIPCTATRYRPYAPTPRYACCPNDVRPLKPASRFHVVAIAMKVNATISGCSAGPPAK